ncbi:hybrid sensor histidine kinase/response regulator [Flavobacterium album]|uniref:histidine kinase n=1 Tax=Flavobacterium album TaxID=2175091 RepID=A0A2S1R2E8_9FLAO|nr:ATP-binding protein [Flavobacterium album]AWH86815.1 hybrid sensor histidine kinase/response regulator [Flavobacterium album]
MVQKPRSVKYKVIAGYVLLFAIAVFSVWFLYSEIIRIAIPAQTGEDNKNIIRISNTIADLYASEAIGRSSILTGSQKDYNRYKQLIDSINNDIEAIKANVEESQVPKFDSIQMLLARKKQSITDIGLYRKKYGQKDALSLSIERIYNSRDSVWDKTKPVKSTRSYEAKQLIYSALPPKMLDSLSKLPVSNDSLAIIFDKVITNVLVKDRKLKNVLNRKEQKLLDENRVISDQLRAILASVEKEFIEKSYARIDQSQAAISDTVKKMTWVGAITLFLLIVFAWVIIRDLTTNQNYRKQLELLNHENEELLRTKSMLMATVTHDLQTPLGSIVGFHDLIKDSGITPKQGQYLGNIKQSADYILKLVNDLLDFSRLENNRIAIENSVFNMKNVIEGTCMTLEPMAQKKNIELNWDIDDKLDRNYISDPYRIKQVLTNLISNAIKFTGDGSVEVTAKIEGFDILISVLDTGIGIAPEKHSDVFKEFTQAHAGIEKKFGGTGLGLTISKKILELLGGTITLESAEGQGSIFTISIPCIAGKSDTPGTAAPASKPEPPALKNKRILVVDDDSTQLTLMSELLGAYVAAIKTEINPSALEATLEQGDFDIVLTDIQMPSVDGFEVLARIRQHPDPAIASLPVIALSGRRDLSADDFVSRGFTAHHPKPVQFEQLLELLAGIFDEKLPVQKTPVEEKRSSGKLYDLKSLSRFTNNDPDSLRTIVLTFIESAKTNCDELLKAVETKDGEQLVTTAHRMIPMLKQMEVHSIAGLLMPLEDRATGLDWPELESYINRICGEVQELCNALEKEVA